MTIYGATPGSRLPDFTLYHLLKGGNHFLFKILAHAAIYLLFAGGLLYTGGMVFYAFGRILYHYAIWHLFVAAGSLCLFLAVSHSRIRPVG